MNTPIKKVNPKEALDTLLGVVKEHESLVHAVQVLGAKKEQLDNELRINTSRLKDMQFQIAKKQTDLDTKKDEVMQELCSKQKELDVFRTSLYEVEAQQEEARAIYNLQCQQLSSQQKELADAQASIEEEKNQLATKNQSDLYDIKKQRETMGEETAELDKRNKELQEQATTMSERELQLTANEAQLATLLKVAEEQRANAFQQAVEAEEIAKTNAEYQEKLKGWERRLEAKERYFEAEEQEMVLKKIHLEDRIKTSRSYGGLNV